MKIILHYRNGTKRTITAPHGMRHPKDGSRAYKVVLDKEAWDSTFVHNAVLQTLDVRDNEGVTCQD